MSELRTNGETPILLSCGIVNGALQLSYNGDALSDHKLTVGFNDSDSDEDQCAEIRIEDFEQDNIRYRVNSWTLEKDGTATSWTREESAARSPELQADEHSSKEIKIKVQAVGYETVEPVSAREHADHELVIYEDDPIDIVVPKKNRKPTP